MFFGLTVFYIFYFIMLSYFTHDTFYPKIRRALVVCVMLYYLIEGYYTNYTTGLLVALVVNLFVALYIASMSLFNRKNSQIIKSVMVGLGVIIVFIFHLFFDFARVEGSIIVDTIENDSYLVEIEGQGAGGTGMFSVTPWVRIQYVDKSKLFKNRRVVLRYTDIISCNDLKLKFKNENLLQIDLTIEDRNLRNVYYEPIIIDLTSKPETINYEYFHWEHKCDSLKEIKDLKIISNGYTEMYAMTFRRLKAVENQVEGDYVITYGSIYQEEAKVLFNVNKSDYATFEFISDSTVEISYYSVIPKPEDDLIYYYDSYNYKDIFVFDYKSIPDINLLLQRKEAEIKLHSR